MSSEKFPRFTGEKGEMLQYLVTSGNNTSKVMDIYTKWAAEYDQDLGSLSEYNPPIHTARICAQIYREGREHIKVLDLASGTGLVGQMLKQHGFEKLDALDGSQAMLDQAKEKGIYNNLYCHMLGLDELTLTTGQYDVIVTTGSFVPGHLDHKCFPDVLTLLKPGGRFILVMAKNYLEDCEEFRGVLEPAMESLVSKGLWILEQKQDVPQYHDDVHGIAYVLRKQPPKDECTA